MPSRPLAHALLRTTRLLAPCALAAALLVAACAPTGPTPRTGSPAASAAPSATTGESGPPPSGSPGAQVGISHPTGATDVVLRVAITGGFIPIEAVAARVPVFTLFGDGLVVVQPEDVPLDAASPPLREARLDAARVQDLLAFAIGPGGLGLAATDYVDGGFIDAATTVISIDAGGLRKDVRVLALESEPAPGPEQAPREALAALVALLRAIPTTADHVPAGIAAVLVELEPDPLAPARAWPWADLSPLDFDPAPPEDPAGFPSRRLAEAELAALGLGTLSGAVIGPTVDAPDGRTYRVVLRPMLPDEAPAR